MSGAASDCFGGCAVVARSARDAFDDAFELGRAVAAKNVAEEAHDPPRVGQEHDRVKARHKEQPQEAQPPRREAVRPRDGFRKVRVTVKIEEELVVEPQSPRLHELEEELRARVRRERKAVELLEAHDREPEAHEIALKEIA